MAWPASPHLPRSHFRLRPPATGPPLAGLGCSLNPAVFRDCGEREEPRLGQRRARDMGLARYMSPRG